MNQKSQALILGLITIVCWGSLATFSNLVIHLPPFYVLGVTFLLGALPSLVRPREIFPNLKTSLIGVFGMFGYHFFLFYSFRFAPAVEANLINYTWPVLMVLLSPVFFKEEKLSWYHIVGAALAVIGCVILVFGKGGELKSENIQGYLLAAGAALTWPIYSMTKKKLPNVSVWAVGGFCFGASILSFITHAMIEPRVSLVDHDAIMLLIMGLGPFGLAFYCWDLALSKGDTRLLGALAYLTPVLSTLGLVLFTGAELAETTLIAMVLIIGGASSGLIDFIPKRKLK
jgi:drug/metabolite transporter (DMT)-like permease